jgi:hypothetical protein
MRPWLKPISFIIIAGDVVVVINPVKVVESALG